MVLKKQFALLSILLLALASCDEAKEKMTTITAAPDASEILKTDADFSDMSRQLGMRKAFLQYMAKEGILLRPDNPPIIGADAIDYLSQVNDSGYVLTWKPLNGDIAKSGELGYTYGVYELALQDTIIKGTYVNVWHKQPNGEWKFVIDSGNQGLSE